LIGLRDKEEQMPKREDVTIEEIERYAKLHDEIARQDFEYLIAEIRQVIEDAAEIIAEEILEERETFSIFMLPSRYATWKTRIFKTWVLPEELYKEIDLLIKKVNELGCRAYFHIDTRDWVACILVKCDPPS
jgi:SpoVK/Ycf46/Vps4 family AAA+-type ATPase